jgi:hypothetical protein
MDLAPWYRHAWSDLNKPKSKIKAAVSEYWDSRLLVVLPLLPFAHCRPARRARL